MRLSSNFSVGLVLGIATASVVLALSGCATTSATTGPAHGGDPAGPTTDPSAVLADFSADEQERILAVQGIVEQAASEHELDPSLINAMIWVESRFQPRAKSPAGARGLMQLMPATAAYLAKRMGEHNARAYDPEFNIRAGSLYLAQMLDKFGDERLAVAAYHAGPGNVKRWVEAGEAFPDYSDAYVAKVMDARARFEGVDALHGRSSGGRSGAAGTLGRSGESEREAKTGSEPDDAMLEVPDVDTLPDAADIHGMPRVIYSDDRNEPEPEDNQPEPESKRPVAKPETPSVPEDEAFEPVFIVHPELDANPSSRPSGWETRNPRPRTRPQAPAAPPSESKPEQAPEPVKPKPEPEPEGPDTGIGVLPDL